MVMKTGADLARCISEREAEERVRMINRLRRIEGQIRGLSEMVASGRPCEDVAQQMAAVRRALERAYMHMMTCTLMEVTDGYTPEGEVKQDVQRVLDLLQKYA